MLKRNSALWVILLGLAVLFAPMRGEAQTFGTNWEAFFFTNADFSGDVVGPISYPQGLNFNWPGVPRLADGVTPVPGFTQEDNFSVRFTSIQNFPQTGNYRFSGFVDDRMTVFINNNAVYQQDTPGQFNFVVPLAAGNYPIRIDYIELTVTAALQFQWALEGAQPGVPGVPGVPPVVGTPAPTPIPFPVGPIGQVVNVNGLSLRTGPYLGASFIGVLRPGIAYPVLAQNNDEGGGFTWYKVENGPQVGWVSGRYFLVLNGTPPFENTIFDELVDPPGTGVIATPNAFINFRRRPSTRSASIEGIQIPWGGQVEVLGRTVQGGRNHWLLVRYEGRVGWVFAPYFRTIRGSFNQVPVY